MSNPRQSATIFASKAAMAAQWGSPIERYGIPLDDPRLFRWIPGSTTAVDGVNVLGHSGGTAGTWQAQGRAAETQATWYIDPDGDDGNTGLTSATALATAAEFFRRIAGVTLTASAITVYIPETLNEDIDGKITLGDSVALTFVGTRSASVRSGTLTAGTRNYAAASAQEARLIDSSLATSWTASLGSDVKLLVRMSLGGGLYADAWIAKDLASKTARISEPFDVTTYAGATIASGNTYTTHTLPRFGNDVTLHVRHGHGSYVVFQDLEIGQAGLHSVEIFGGNVTFITCAINGLDVYSNYNCALLGCKTVDGFRGHGAILQSYSSLHYSTSSPPSGDLFLSNALVQGISLNADSNKLVEIAASAWCACFDSTASGNGVEILSGGILKVFGTLFGTCGASSSGVFVEVGGHGSYRSTIPIAITGGLQDTTIGGTTKSYATLSTAGFFNTTTGASLVGTTFARG